MLIESVKDLLEVIDLSEKSKMFRGHAVSSWKLIPSIARLLDRLSDHDPSFSSWVDLEDYLLKNFENQSAPFWDKAPDLYIELLIHAQHHGLPTALLDWSTNPLKALFFAVENPAYDDEDGAFFKLQPSSWHISYESMEKAHGLVAFHPKQINGRVLSQEGCFTKFPFPNDLAPIPSLEDEGSFVTADISSLDKFEIPKYCKANIRSELKLLGIHHQSIYPGLDGVCTKIRREFGLV